MSLLCRVIDLWNYGKTRLHTEAEIDALDEELGLCGEERAALRYGYSITNALTRGLIIAFLAFVVMLIGAVLWTCHTQ